MQVCSQDLRTLPQAWAQCEPGMPASSHSPGLWHVFLHTCDPHLSFFPQGSPQWTSLFQHGRFFMISFPQIQGLSIKDGHLGQEMSSG